RGGDLGKGAGKHPWPKHVGRPRWRYPCCDQNTGEKEQREWKAEKETNMSGADRSKSRGQLALRRIASGLRCRSDQRKDDPEHFLSVVTPEFDQRIHGDCRLRMSGVVD